MAHAFRQALSGLCGGFGMGTVYSLATSDTLPDRPHDERACETVLYSIQEEPAGYGIVIGAAALLGGRWTLLGLLAGTFGGATEEHTIMWFVRRAYESVRQ